MRGNTFCKTETGNGQKGDIKIKQNKDVLKKKRKSRGMMVTGKERVSMGLCIHA